MVPFFVFSSFHVSSMSVKYNTRTVRSEILLPYSYQPSEQANDDQHLMAVYIGNNNAQLCIEKYKDVRCCLYLFLISSDRFTLRNNQRRSDLPNNFLLLVKRENVPWQRIKKKNKKKKKTIKTTRFSLKGDRNFFTNCPFQQVVFNRQLHIHVFLNINFVTAAFLRDEACEC